MVERETKQHGTRAHRIGSPDRRDVMQRLVVGGAVALLASTLLPGAAEAKRRKRARGGRRNNGVLVYITQTRPPSLLTEQALLGWARGHTLRVLEEARQSDSAAGRWDATLVVHFRRPVGDLEYRVRFYDRGPDGRSARSLAHEQAFMLDSRDQRTFVQPVQMTRPAFRPGHHYDLVVTVRQTEMSDTRFRLSGGPPAGTE